MIDNEGTDDLGSLRCLPEMAFCYHKCQCPLESLIVRQFTNPRSAKVSKNLFVSSFLISKSADGDPECVIGDSAKIAGARSFTDTPVVVGPGFKRIESTSA